MGSGTDFNCTRNSKKEECNKRNKDIAIIGIGLKFPLADTAEEFWNLLRNGICTVRDIPWKRKFQTESYLAFRGKAEEYTFEKAGYLEHIDCFDHSFFHISPKEASYMDPNQRIFLQTVWEAVEDSGYGAEQMRGSNTGIYVGYSGDAEYRNMIAETEPEALPIATAGNLPAVIGGRVSHLMDLQGPNLLVNTMCSSSLVAIHLACQAIRTGECDMAVAGGIQLHILPVRMAKIGIESGDNLTKSFDDSSDGTGGGEGSAAILLKPLHRAERDRDNIYAVIKGSALNQDGATAGISAPSPGAQKRVIIRAWEDAGIHPESITYMEAHGSGTKLGDPIEVQGICGAFQEYTDRKQFCGLGSVKSNLGHLDACAGAAGFIKAVLSLKYREIPATLHVNRPNRNIRFQDSPVYINSVRQTWEKSASKRRCGVSSFGFSGTNCHIVLEEYVKQMETGTGDKNYLLPLSAKTKAGLMRLTEKYINYFTTHKQESLSDICCTAGMGRGHYEYRLGIICGSREEFIDQLRAFDPDKKPHALNTFYGFFELIPEDGREKEGHMRTEQEVRRLSADADYRAEQYDAGKENNHLLLQEIASLYVKGARINWKLLYGGQRRNKVSIPLYPFEETTHWLTIPANPARLQELDETIYYRTLWRESPLESNASKAAAEGFTLVFMNSGKRCGQLADALEFYTQNLIRVYVGDAWKKQERTVYTVSSDKKDILRLFRDLPGISSIVYMHSLPDPDVEQAKADKGQEEHILYPFLAVAAAIEESLTEPFEFVLLTGMGVEADGSEPYLSGFDAMLICILKCLCAENSYVSGRSIDIDMYTEADVAAEDVMGSCGKVSIVYRKGKRYKEVLMKAEIPMNQNHQTQLREEGVYVITGGTGGLGLVTASFLAERAPVRIALINRTPLPERKEWKEYLNSGADGELRKKIQQIQDLERSGAKIECYAADILDLEHLCSLFGQLEKSYLRINGIIHCAGVGVGMKGKAIHELTGAEFKMVMEAKVRGTCNLEFAVRHMQLDFFLVYSSPVTLTGGYGSAAYAAANAFLNIWARKRSRAGAYPAIAVSWAPWEESFLNEDYNSKVHMFQTLSSKEIRSGLNMALKSGLCEIIVGRMNRKAELLNTRELLFFELDRQIVWLLDGNLKHGRLKNSDFNAYDIKITGTGGRNLTPYEEIAAKAFGIILEFKTIDLYDNFFELGGDSIIALKIINLINDKCGISIVTAELLKNPCVKELAAVIEEKMLKKQITNPNQNVIKPLEKRPFYPLSSAQRRIYMLSQKESIGTAYHLTEFIQMDGDLQISRLENVLIKLIQRHEGLRTTFEMREGMPVQMIRETVDFKLKCKKMEEQSYEKIAEQFVKPFELSRQTFRVELYEFTETRHLLLIDMHHIICDGVSRTILLKEMAELYNGKVLPLLRIQYKEFACWEQEAVSARIRKDGEAFWKNMLGHGLPLLKLPVKSERPPRQIYKGSERKLFMEEGLSENLKAYAKKQGCSLFVVLLSVYFILLEKYTGEKDIVVGTAFAGREQKELESVTGIFLNLLPIRCYPEPGKLYTDFLMEVKEVILLANENQNFPLEEMITVSGIKVQPGRNPLYDTMFLMQNTGCPQLCMDGLTVKTHRFKNQSSKLDLTLEIEEVQKQLCIVAEYSSKLFEEAMVDGLIMDYMELLKKIIENGERKMKDIWLDSNIKIPKKAVLDMDFSFDW